MDKVCRIGARTLGGRNVSVYVRIKIVDGNLSIVGVEGLTKSGYCLGSCGQIVGELKRINNFVGDWERWLPTFTEIWERWHLNDMKAGTIKQEDFLRKKKSELNVRRLDYEVACKYLEEAGLLIDNGYKYGTSWLKEELPSEVIAFLEALPETDKTPAWV